MQKKKRGKKGRCLVYLMSLTFLVFAFFGIWSYIIRESPKEEEDNGEAIINYELYDNSFVLNSDRDFVKEIFENGGNSSLEIDYPNPLQVESILQNPELPTGCEVTSLAIVLNYYGYDADKCVLATDYLKRADYGEADFSQAFIGSPESDGGYGCYAPVIVECANKYLTQKGSIKKAYNISGIEFEELYMFVDKGTPVIVWASMNLSDISPRVVWQLNGKDIYWLTGEHCMVLTGYDRELGVIYVSDPLRGNVTYTEERFKQVYNMLSKQAVVVY